MQASILAMMIAITRLEEKAGKDAALCMKYGHLCRTVSPLKAVVHERKAFEFAERANMGEFDCIFFTSALPAHIIGPLLNEDIQSRIVAIGPQTARTLSEAGLACETLPSYYSRDFADYLNDWLSMRRVGLPRADVPNPVLISSIEEKGGFPVDVPVYSLCPTGAALDLEGAEVLIFTSANSYTHSIWERRENLIIGAIGEITGERMKGGGDPPDFCGNGSLEGALQALNTYLSAAEEQ